MPKPFDNCVAGGGKIITKRVNTTMYMHICFPKGGGPSVAGEEMMYKKILKTKKK